MSDLWRGRGETVQSEKRRLKITLVVMLIALVAVVVRFLQLLLGI